MALNNSFDALRAFANPLLTWLAQGYVNEQFVSSFVMPDILVKSDIGKYPIFGTEGFNDHNSNFEIDGEIKEITRELVDFGSWEVLYNALKTNIDYRVIKAMQDNLDTSMVKMYTRILKENLDMQKEKEAITLMTTAGSYNATNITTLSGTDCFDDAGSDPIATINALRETIRLTTGKYPNRGIFGPTVMTAIRKHAKVKAAISANKDVIVNEELIEKLLSTKDNPFTLKIGAGMVNNPLHKTDPATYSKFTNLWSDDIILAYVPPGKMDRMTPAFAKNFVLKGSSMVYTKPEVTKTEIGVITAQQPTITQKNSGGWIKNCIGA